MGKDVSVKRSLLRIGLAAVLLCLGVGIFLYRQGLGREAFFVEIIPPTCTDGGYSLYTHKENGSTVVKDVVPALGHAYGDWSCTREPETVLAGEEQRSCSRCALTETRFVYPELTLATVQLEGDLTGIGKKAEVPVYARFVSRDTTFETWATLKHQGHSTLQYPKKNYTLKLFRDEALEEKYKITFSHWNKENKYILKANYTDPSQCRNLICADIWAAMVQSRKDVPEELKDLSNYGAVDGFPVALYCNGQFQGLYNWNLHKDDDLFGMEEDAQHAIMIANSGKEAESHFRESAAFTENSAWEVEFCGTKDSTWAKNKLNELITFVREADDETFRKQIGTYLDVEAAIDYLLAVYALGLTDHGAKDLLLVTYSQTQPWIASLYDMEDAFGLTADGRSAVAADVFLPVKTENGWDSATGNLLWDRLLEQFYPELAARYGQLRENLLTPEAICDRVEAFVDAIPQSLYQADATVSGYDAQAIHGAEQIKAYITARIPLLDSIFGK